MEISLAGLIKRAPASRSFAQIVVDGKIFFVFEEFFQDFLALNVRVLNIQNHSKHSTFFLDFHIIFNLVAEQISDILHVVVDHSRSLQIETPIND